MNTLARSLLVLVLARSAPGFAATFTVGADPACTHATLAQAVAAAAANGPAHDEIRLVAAPGLMLAAPLVIDQQSLAIIGGYATCDAAEPTGTTSYALLAGDGFMVHGGNIDNGHEVSLSRIALVGEAGAKRLLAIDGFVAVTLDQADLSGGHAVDGAGIHLVSPAKLSLETDARIHHNVASNNGGGIYCGFAAKIALGLATSIDANTAGAAGGGAYLDGCTLTATTGGAERTIGGHYGITANTAGVAGGGVYGINGALVVLQGTLDPARLSENTADSGGGLALDGAATTAALANALVTANSATIRGGGFDLVNGAQLLMGRSTADCPGEQFCSRLIDNHADAPGAIGGGASARGGANLKLQQTEMRGNTAADGGAAVDARDTDTLAVIEGAFLFGHVLRPATYSGAGAWLRAAYVSSYANSGGAFGLGDGGRTSVYSSVIQDEVFILPMNGTTTRFADCVTVKEADSIPPGLDIVEVRDDPAALFRNPASGDLRPRPHASSIDRCDTFAYVPTTLDVYGFARGFDVPSESTSPSFGPLDQGAVEAPWLFADDFEG